MITALVLIGDEPSSIVLGEDLRAVGIRVLETVTCIDLVQVSLRTDPKMVVCVTTQPVDALFQSIASLGTLSPRPVVVFTTDQQAENAAAAITAGVHAYVVNGYARARLRSVLQLAQARFDHDHALQLQLTALQQRFEERKLVDRAKGILMGARQLREEEAFRALRSTAMAAKLRIGQVSQQVIDRARYAEATNRAGQLRMMSQRVVKLYAFCCIGKPTAAAAQALSAAVSQTDDNLTFLSRSLSNPTFGDLLDAVAEPWARLRNALLTVPQLTRLQDVDAKAEIVLIEAEQLTGNLEVAAFAAALRVVNVVGRQRMLSQRVAKDALLSVLRREGPEVHPASWKSVTEILQGMDYLATLPLGSPDITRELDAARAEWQTLADAIDKRLSPSGPAEIVAASERLLTCFDRLTELTERAVQSLFC